MKVFISQPMSKLSEEEVMKTRARAVEIIKKRHPLHEIEVIDNYKHDIPDGSHPLQYLGRDILMMSTADLVFFVDGYINARGCRCEHKIARDYGLNIEYEYVLDEPED